MNAVASRAATFIKSTAIFLTLVVVLLGASSASAQDLKLPSSVFVMGAAADWVSTYQFTQRGARETNPFISGLQSNPSLMIATGAAMDVAGLWAWNRYVGKNHPRLAAVGLYAAAGFRVWLAAHNNSLNRR